jgi:hypothetical protein
MQVPSFEFMQFLQWYYLCTHRGAVKINNSKMNLRTTFAYAVAG